MVWIDEGPNEVFINTAVLYAFNLELQYHLPKCEMYGPLLFF